MSAFRKSPRPDLHPDPMIAALERLEAEVQRLKALFLDVAAHVDNAPVDAARAMLSTATERNSTSLPVATEPADWSRTAPGLLFIHLYHGRKHPSDNLEDWGADGPIIGPLAYVHTTYRCDVKFAASPDVMDRFFPTVMANWRAQGLSNFHGPLCDWQFNVVEDMIEFDGVYYGDWSVFVADVESVEATPEKPPEQD